MEGVPCANPHSPPIQSMYSRYIPKDYGGHIDSEIMGYLFANNNISSDHTKKQLHARGTCHHCCQKLRAGQGTTNARKDLLGRVHRDSGIVQGNHEEEER